MYNTLTYNVSFKRQCYSFKFKFRRQEEGQTQWHAGKPVLKKINLILMLTTSVVQILPLWLILSYKISANLMVTSYELEQTSSRP